MTSDPRAFLAVDQGAATTSAALIGRLAHRWRVIGSLATPAPGDVDAIGTELVRRVHAADPDLADGLGLTIAGAPAGIAELASDLPRLVARSAPARTLLAMAVSDRALQPLATAARKTGWRTRGASLDRRDPLPPTVARLAAARADVLDRRIELIEIGFDGGLRATASPGVEGGEGTSQVSIVADAALVPPDPDDVTVDRVLAWATISLDRHRLRDRLRELRLWPWSGIAGDGAGLRLASARAALGVLVDATPDQ